jgi:hypothetical protein
MTEEERQPQMDFILNTLAQVTVKVDGLADSLAKSDQERRADAPRIARLEDSFVTLTRLAERFNERLDEHHTRVADVEQAVVMLTKLVGEGHNGEAR